MSDRVVVPFPVKPPTEFKIESGVPIPPIGEAGDLEGKLTAYSIKATRSFSNFFFETLCDHLLPP